MHSVVQEAGAWLMVFCDALQSRTDRVVTQGQQALSSDTTGLDSDRYLCEEKAGETQEKYCTIVSACVL